MSTTDDGLAGLASNVARVRQALREQRLSDADRQLIAEARRVGPVLRAGSSDRDRLAGWLLDGLADLAERLGGAR